MKIQKLFFQDLEKLKRKYDSFITNDSYLRRCEIIRDKRTQASLQYAFIEFDTDESCERAYFKMDNGNDSYIMTHTDKPNFSPN